MEKAPNETGLSWRPPSVRHAAYNAFVHHDQHVLTGSLDIFTVSWNRPSVVEEVSYEGGETVSDHGNRRVD